MRGDEQTVERRDAIVAGAQAARQLPFAHDFVLYMVEQLLRRLTIGHLASRSRELHTGQLIAYPSWVNQAFRCFVRMHCSLIAGIPV